MILGDFGVFDTETEFLDHQNYQSFIEFSAFAGDDEIYGGDGDDFLFGQEVSGRDDGYLFNFHTRSNSSLFIAADLPGIG